MKTVGTKRGRYSGAFLRNMYLKLFAAKMKKYLAEAIGTFALVFCGTGAIVINEVFEDLFPVL